MFSDQLEELRLLQIRSEEEAQTLRQVAEEAGTCINVSQDSFFFLLTFSEILYRNMDGTCS
jgi:hypothetical protein